MPVLSWQETRYYDPINDRDSLRLTGFSGRGAYWIDRPLSLPGKSRRVQREHLLRLIEQAIERGDTPGEVAYVEPAPERMIDPVFDPDRY